MVKSTDPDTARAQHAPEPVGVAVRIAGLHKQYGPLRAVNNVYLDIAPGEVVALVSDPDLLVLDEPTAAMDVGTRHEFWRSMQQFTDQGRTVLFATHYLEEAEEFADRVILMREGGVVANGSVAEVRVMASERTLSATIPGVSEESITVLPEVREVGIRGDQATIKSSASDVTLRALLYRFPDARDIEITGVGLDEAFLALTTNVDETRVGARRK